MGASFKFLSDEEFLRLDPSARLAYINRAQKEIREVQRVLREQMRMTMATDTDKTVPAGPARRR